MISLQELVSRLFTLLNSGSYYKSSTEIQNAINSASEDLYDEYRNSMNVYSPNNTNSSIAFQETLSSADALQEFYQIFTATGNPLVVEATGDYVLDRIQVLEATFPVVGVKPVKILPDNQWLRAVDNKVTPPIAAWPIGRLSGLFTYEILPNTYTSVSARCLCYPIPCAFTFVDNDSPIPTVVTTAELGWQADKMEQILARTISKLGFNLSNGVLVQAGSQMSQKLG